MKSKHEEGSTVNAPVIAGGDMTGVVGGSGNITSIKDVTSYGHMVDQAGQVNVSIRDALKATRQDIDSMADQDEKSTLEAAFQVLTDLLLKNASPKKTILQSAWNAVSAFASSMPSLMAIGKLLVARFGITV